MVDRTRELEYALGDGNKVVEPNEKETVVIQRRCLRAARDLRREQFSAKAISKL
jgi:N-acetylneuraminate synthase